MGDSDDMRPSKSKRDGAGDLTGGVGVGKPGSGKVGSPDGDDCVVDGDDVGKSKGARVGDAVRLYIGRGTSSARFSSIEGARVKKKVLTKVGALEGEGV